MVVSVRRETLGGEPRDSSPEMVGGSWEGGFREERSKCTAPCCVCVCACACMFDVRGLCGAGIYNHYDN